MATRPAIAPPPTPEADWHALDAAIAGDVTRPGAAEYDARRRPAILGFDHVRPQAVVRCADPQAVAAAIAFARRAGLPIAVRSGGHCFAGRSSTDGLLIDVSPMNGVAVAGDAATIGAGARLGNVYDALDAHGRTIAAGCGTTVGIAGLALGGGLGVLGRRHGLTSDGLRAAQVVLADGRIVWCDAGREASLFWALRGAGGARFGVVTALQLATIPAPPATAFRLRWAPADAAALLDAWQRWAPAAPDEMAASLLMTAGAGAAGEPRVVVFGAMTGTRAATARRLEALGVEAGAAPTSAALASGSFRDAKRFLADDGDEGGEGDEGHPLSRSEFFARPLPPPVIAALVRHLVEAREAGYARELDFTPWGGAYNRVAPEATAFAHRDARFLLKHGVSVDARAPEAARGHARDWLARSWALAHPFGTGGVYPNFPEPERDPWADAYHGTNGPRLRRVKRAYDPDGVFGPVPQDAGV